MSDEEHDTDRPPPPPQLGLDQLVGLFRAGRIGQQARNVRLTGLYVAQVDTLLRREGFRVRAEPVFAGRDHEARAQYWLIDGSTTSDANAPDRLAEFVYAAEDGSLVRVHPFGDPRGRMAPRDVPIATKSVCSTPSSTWTDDKGRERFTADTSRANEAFRVSDDGAPVPKSYRRADGVKDISKDPVACWRAAVELVPHGILRLKKP